MEIHLASMENITCWAFRSLMQGVSDSYTGMISMGYLIERHKAWKEVDMYPISSQRQWLQVLTSRENECKKFLERINEKLSEEPEKDNCYGIQLNCSCPSPMITGIGQGSALVKRPLKVYNLVSELLKQDKFKVSLKTRLGLNPLEIKEGRIFKLLEELEKIKDPNFTEVVVHFRHAKERSDSPYDYSPLKEILDFNIPIVINGGINCYRDYNNIVKNIPKRKNIKGIMIGREALKNPDCFVEVSNMLNCTLFKNRNLEEINKDFRKLCEEHVPRDIYLKRIADSCSWYME
ncbi:tRNA-dihydrouridine(20/20a) synthase [uncultured archaeon]|nr:tRNA-dihydrouridine(20/20a) synthase [uncultured archaeon]